MANLAISFSVEGDDKVVAMFDTGRKRAGNLRGPMNAIGAYMLDEIDKNYGGRGSKWGKWRRRTRSYSHPLLELTGKMRGGFWKEATRDSVTIGNHEKKFKFHQSSKPRKGNLPRRVMMEVADEQRRESVRILQKHIMEK